MSEPFKFGFAEVLQSAVLATPPKDYWSQEAHEARMRKGWPAPGTICGPGSMPVHAAQARVWLPSVIHRYGLRRVVNAGAGDLNWWPEMFEFNTMRHFDLIPRHPLVEKLDFLVEPLPECDVVVCRHVLIHFDPVRVRLALERFREVAPYLIASTYTPGQQFKGLDCTLYDLREVLGEPVESTLDAQQVGREQRLALWKLR